MHCVYSFLADRLRLPLRVASSPSAHSVHPRGLPWSFHWRFLDAANGFQDPYPLGLGVSTSAIP
ncbi:hypothetical protein BJY00DRAFT_280159 [Aspergillus carlsbadensis]|nr:hypothetical protein BJY00DRAFT_280159 [Aspergillus carlsbadensis]